MKSTLILITNVLLYHTECANIIYYSNGETKSYDDAEKYCNSIDSTMLSYGSNIVDAAEECKMTGFAWLGKPWIKYRGLIYMIVCLFDGV